MANRSLQRLIGMLLLLAVSACTGPQPTLRSNKQLHMHGRQSGLQHGTNQSTNAATGAVLGLTLGGAVGASAGVVGGLPGIAIGAAAGSGLGFIVGLLGGTFKPLEPDPPYADAVTRCLKDKGYEVSGWE